MLDLGVGCDPLGKRAGAYDVDTEAFYGAVVACELRALGFGVVADGASVGEFEDKGVLGLGGLFKFWLG